MQPYSENRNGFNSHAKEITCGVPQGSSLGPLLSLILLCIEIEIVVNYELKLVTQWMKSNKLSLNTDKTNFVLFHSRQHLFDKCNLSIKLNNKQLNPVDYVK